MTCYQRPSRSSWYFQLRHKRPGGGCIYRSIRCKLSIDVISINSPFRRLNTSPNTIEDTDILKLHLVNPPVKKIDLHFPLGLEVSARNNKGVTVKDALDAIYKQFKKKVTFHPGLHVTLNSTHLFL